MQRSSSPRETGCPVLFITRIMHASAQNGKELMSKNHTTSKGQIRSFQMPSNFWVQRASQSDQQGKLTRAAALLRHAARQEDCSPEALQKYAWLLRRMGCIEGSNRECFSILASYPSRFSVYGLIALNLMDLGKKQQAVDAYVVYSQYVQMFPGREPPWDAELCDLEDQLFLIPSEEMQHARSRRLLDQAWRMLDDDNREQTKGLFERIWQMKGHSAESLCLAACLSEEKDFSRRAVRSVSALAGNNVTLLIRCAQAAARYSRREAGWLLLKAACLVRKPEDLSLLCTVCRAHQLDGIAMAELKAAYRINPARLDVLYQLCVFALGNGDTEQAKNLGRRLETLDPEDLSVQRLLRHLKQTDIQKINMPFYYQRDQELEQDCRQWLKEITAPDRDTEVYSSPLTRENRHKLMYLLANVLEETEAIALLRWMERRNFPSALSMVAWYMLHHSESRGLRKAARMLSKYINPPYMTQLKQRLQLLSPEKSPSRSKRFFHHNLFGLLRSLRNHHGKESLPFALKVLEKLPKKDRIRLAVNRDRAWIPAFDAEFARRNQQPLPIMHYYMLHRPRMLEWRKARRVIRRAMEQITDGK